MVGRLQIRGAMKTILTLPGLARLDHDPAAKIFVMHWTSYLGPHFKQGIEALLAESRRSGIFAYISNASAAKDVPAQPDFQWVESHVKPELLKAGLKRFITVVPQSAIAKMGTQRFGKVAANAGVETYAVASLDDALDAARAAKAA